jgi:hypothetical protein
MFLEDDERIEETPYERLSKLVSLVKRGLVWIILLLLDVLLVAFRKINTLRFFILVIALCCVNLVALITLNEIYLAKDNYTAQPEVLAKETDSHLNLEIAFLR